MIEKEGKEIVKPQYLKEGDKVALISPAYWVPEEVILKAAEVIRSWGLEPVIGAHTTNLILDAYSGTADERAADLLWALEDDTIWRMTPLKLLYVHAGAMVPCTY